MANSSARKFNMALALVLMLGLVALIGRANADVATVDAASNAAALLT